MHIVTRKDIDALVKELGEGRDLYGPRADAATGQAFFDRLAAPADLDLDAPIPSMPPKEILFPQLERVMTYRYGGPGEAVAIEPRFAPRPKALVGLRPCDLAGIRCLDRFMLGQEFVDEVYLAHRKACFLVTQTCAAPFPQCFCVCTDSGPGAAEGFDLDLTPLPEGGWLLLAGSDEGRALAERLGRKLGWRKSGDDAAARKREVIDRSIARFPEASRENKAWISRVMNRITTGFIKHDLWEGIGDRCFECGACSFVCPTCSCFNVEDRLLRDGGCERLRTRDSCSFEGYTRMAGDHNPRKPVEDRRNKRFFCKLSYSQARKYLRPSCVGCGRCVWVCPGDIGMANVVQYIRREKCE